MILDKIGKIINGSRPLPLLNAIQQLQQEKKGEYESKAEYIYHDCQGLRRAAQLLAVNGMEGELEGMSWFLALLDSVQGIRHSMEYSPKVEPSSVKRISELGREMKEVAKQLNENTILAALVDKAEQEKGENFKRGILYAICVFES